MAVTPQSNIQLLNTPLTEDQENQLTFTNLAAQNAYFEGLSKLTENNCTYQRKDNILRFPAQVDSLRKYNYCRYQNKQFGNKWFYAFITKMEYVNENMTYIYLKTDVYQTWMFEMELEPSFVEREHVSDDSIGAHTYPEGLEYGEYIVNKVNDIMPYTMANNIFFVMQVTDLPSGHGISPSDLPAKQYNGMPSGCYYLAFKYNQMVRMQQWIGAYDEGKADAILSIFPLPDTLIGALTGSGIPQQPVPVANSITDNTYIIPSSNVPVNMYETTIIPGNRFQGYVPKNNKLYTAPYCYFNVCTLTGSTISYNWEDFAGNPEFELDGAVTTGGEYKFYPLNYKNSYVATKGGYAYGVNLSPLPQASWNTDTYQNWLALNSDALTIQTTASVAQAAVGGIGNLFGGNIFGAVSQGISAMETIALANNQRRVASLAPDQARGDTATKTLTFSENMCFGRIYQMSIKAEYAAIIDEFFTMYGYKINSLKVPNIHSRTYFNYVKTIRCNIKGNLPQDDLIELKNIFDRGCTFWHNPNNFLDYSVNNDII